MQDISFSGHVQSIRRVGGGNSQLIEMNSFCILFQIKVGTWVKWLKNLQAKMSTTDIDLFLVLKVCYNTVYCVDIDVPLQWTEKKQYKIIHLSAFCLKCLHHRFPKPSIQSFCSLSFIKSPYFPTFYMHVLSMHKKRSI